jgi:hypothetical protein
VVQQEAAIFDAAYPAGDNPRAQSGFGGDEARWEIARRPITWPIDRDGTFLDIGCANGYLMESVVRWTCHHKFEPVRARTCPRGGRARPSAATALGKSHLPRQCADVAAANAV